MLEAELAHERLDLGGTDRFVGVAAHPVVHVMLKVHAAAAFVVGNIVFEVAAFQGQSYAEQIDVERERGALRAVGGGRVPAFFASPEAAHAGLAIKRKREQSARADQLRGDPQRLDHGAGMMQHAPRVDDVESSDLPGIEVEYAELPHRGSGTAGVAAQYCTSGLHRGRVDV